MNQAEFQSLTRKRASQKAKLTGFANFIDLINTNIENRQLPTDLDIIQLEERLNKIQETLLDNYDEIQSQLENIAENMEEQFHERHLFEQNYYKQIALAKKLLSDYTNSNKNVGIPSLNHSSHGSIHSESNNHFQGIKLPTIQLPKFNGDYHHWLEFRDTFKSLIHENADINDIQKFHYLRATLEGSASQIIKSIEFTANNYQMAWNLLLERFNNARLLVHNHVKALFNLSVITKESSEKIRNLLDSVSKHLRALEQLEQPTVNWDTLIIYLITTKLDETTARKWEQYKIDNEVPTLENLKTFLKGRADMLETLEIKNQSQKKNFKPNTNTRGFFSSTPNCAYCKKDHYIYNCNEFIKLPVQERIEKVRNIKLCINCLRFGHHSKVCRLGNCKRCNLKHHTMLHIEQAKTDNIATTSNNGDSMPLAGTSPNQTHNKSENNSQSISLSSSSSIRQVLLSTAYINVLDIHGVTHTIRALLDSGSMSSFITSDLCDKLELNTTKIHFAVAGLNQTISKIDKKCEVTVRAKNNTFTANISCFVLQNITGNLPSIQLDITQFDIPKNINMADPTFYKPDKIDMLIGADLFWNLICTGQIRVGVNKPVLQKTKLGWIISGPINVQESNKVQCNFSEHFDIQRQLSRFWEIEEGFPTKAQSQEEKACEAEFVKHTKRDADGRFIVSIPLKDSVEKLGDSRKQAEKRFLTLEAKLQSNPKLKNQYIQFMSEYRELGHMTKVQDIDSSVISYFMPHQGVLREDRLTTKLRVVFDASAVTTSGYSFNDLQMVGPTIQEDILSILLRFRKHTYVVSGDIAKMYRQILINPEQRQLHRILWRPNVNEELDVYELNTVTYGTAAASYLAVRCLYQLALNIRESNPKIAKIIERDFYVDDLLTGSDSINEAAQICKEVSEVLNTGCFELRKFYSNNPDALKYVKNSDPFTKLINLGTNENAKTLGLIWHYPTDNLTYVISEFNNQKITKRTILSNIAQVFDPLGLLSPCTITAKIIMQKLWLEKVSWDEALPADIHTIWSKFREQIPNLSELRINRHVICENATNIQLHGFSDSSEVAFGSAIFIRSENHLGDVSVHLLCAKSKVAPLKSITLPRLELCGALTLIRLTKRVLKSWDIKFDQCVFWTDSMIVLSWLKTAPNHLKPFISTRVAEIQEFPFPHEWKHVSGKENPADLLTRGINPNQIKNLQLWWHGPDWLAQNQINWPNLSTKLEELPELRNRTQVLITIQNNAFPFEKFSSINRLKRVTAFIFRFKNNCQKSRELRQCGPLLLEEINYAFECLIKVAQKQSFPVEYHHLCQGKEIDNKSRVLKLNPFLDGKGIIRVGGRIQNSNFLYDKKHPILICSKHHLTRLLFVNEHLRLLHAGPQLTLASLREKFWPLVGRNLAKKITRECVICFRYNPQTVQPIMGQLPEARLQPGPPFNVTGVDYAGPFWIKDKKGRGARLSKCYVSLFVCFATKAIHLELVTELTKDAFILALKRFVSRRGKPTQILSDNGKNFVAAASELKTFLKQKERELTESILQENIEWKFIPPYSPHFGGLWEAGVKSSKHHLKRVLGDAHLTFEEFYTLLVQVEAVLNSRPLFPMSSDPNDLNSLTPAHFLIGRPLTSITEPDLGEIKIGRLSRYQLISKIQQDFWSRWQKEYVSELQQRSRWKRNQGELSVGSMVIIKQNKTPPQKWTLGRVKQLHPGPDNISRVATIHTNSGDIKRAFSKICPLPVKD